MKLGKRFISLALALVMVFGLTVEASAATTENIKVQLSPDITVTYNGKVQNMTDVNGDPVYPLLNGGTTYLPVRAVSNMLGIDVDWDGATQTVILTDPAGGRQPGASTTSTSAKPASSTITVQLSPDITVEYNGEAQNMTDVNGTPVYPLLNGGTTYLPIRAVSNMLGVDVDWDEATQTVLLGKALPSGVTIIDNGDGTETCTVKNATPEKIRQAMLDAGFSSFFINIIAGSADTTHAMAPEYFNGTDDYSFSYYLSDATLFKTSRDAQILGKNHIGYDYAEIDWSNADDGYVRVKLNEQEGTLTNCTVRSYDDEGNSQNSYSYILDVGNWASIPLRDGAAEYSVIIQPRYKDEGANQRGPLKAGFTAEIENPDAWLTLSSIDVDFENAPKTCAKALELTKNCETDAEKVEAIFNWVAKNVKYDRRLSAEIDAWNAKLDAGEFTMFDRFKNGAREYLVLDTILTTKSGVCEDFATLTVGMLRSLGIPCKYISGDSYLNRKWVSHGWVAIDPSVSGLNLSTFHGWKDADGWLNIDPTNAISSPSLTSNASNYKAERAY